MAKLICILSAFLALSASAEIGDSYFNGDCEVLLEKLNQGQLEEHLVSKAETDVAMVQLLAHYQVIFHPDFAKALLPALAAKGVQFEKVTGGQKARLAELKKVIDLGSDEVDSLTEMIVENIQSLKAADNHLRNQNQARIESLRLQRLFAAINAQPNAKKMFQKIMQRVVKSAMTEIALAELSSIRWDYANNRFSKADAQFPLLMIGASILGSAAGMGSLSNGLLAQFKEPSLVALLVGVAVGITSLYSSLYAVDKISNRRMIRTEEKFSEFDPQFVIFENSGEASAGIKKKYDNLLAELNQYSRSGVVSIENACHQKICVWNPIEIAYMGHVDLLDIEAREVAIKDAAAKEKSMRGFELTTQFAREILSAPNSVSLQLKFRRELDRWLAEVEKASFARLALSEDLKKRISFSAASIRTLREKVFSERIGTATDEDLKKFELLNSKLNGDLATLLKIEANIDKLTAWGEKLKARAERIKEILEDLPKDEFGWEPHIMKIIAELEQWGS